MLFIDEMHRLPRPVEEILYPALGDGAIDIVLGTGPHARDVRLNLERFNLVGATTRYSLISTPLRERFGLVCRLAFYSPTNLGAILHRGAGRCAPERSIPTR